MKNDFELSKEDLIRELSSYREAHQKLSNSAIKLRMQYNNFIKKVKEIRDNLAYMGAEYGVDEAVNDLSELLGDEEDGN